LINVGTGYLNAGVEPTRYGNAHPTVVPYQVFDAADGSFALAVGNDRMFIDFCEQVIELPELAIDPRFTTSHQRAVHRDALLPLLAARLHGQSCDHWIEACHRASVPAGRVKTVAEGLQSPSVIARGVIQRLQHRELGEVALIRPAHGLAAQESHAPKAPPLLGEDTKEVLARVLGLDDTQIAELVASGAIACHEAAAESLPA
jgi:crotonobetainyl-CoA:carnitine CoA-transferase CaiB-like acyl-CoA transferase